MTRDEQIRVLDGMMNGLELIRERAAYLKDHLEAPADNDYKELRQAINDIFTVMVEELDTPGFHVTDMADILREEIICLKQRASLQIINELIDWAVKELDAPGVSAKELPQLIKDRYATLEAIKEEAIKERNEILMELNIALGKEEW